MSRYHAYWSSIAVQFACIGLVTLAGCGGGGSGAGNGGSPSSLLTGTVFHEFDGGVCCKPPTDTPIPSAELTFQAAASGAAVASVRTNASGGYAVRLPAGAFVVVMADPAAEPVYNTVEPSQIQVSLNTPETLDIKFIEDVP